MTRLALKKPGSETKSEPPDVGSYNVRSHQRFGQHFRHVLGADRRQVLDLVAATCPRRHHDVSKGLAPDYLNERFRDFHRKFVFRFQHSKRTRHAAATRFEHRHRPLRHPGAQLVHVI